MCSFIHEIFLDIPDAQCTCDGNLEHPVTMK